MTEVNVGDEAVNHLLHVTSGLDSIVLGETQISWAIKNASLICPRI